MTATRHFLHHLLRLAALALCMQLPAAGLAFELDQLRSTLTAAPVVRGTFVQEKHLRALPQPLVSRGTFVLAAGHGVLWQLRSPLQQTLRITAQGIAREQADGTWLNSPQGNSRESHMFLALLSGDTVGLAENFDLRLEGNADDWRLHMVPNSAIVRQIFTEIEIRGGALVRRIELRETQGDSTVLRMDDVQAFSTLNSDELRAFAN